MKERYFPQTNPEESKKIIFIYLKMHCIPKTVNLRFESRNHSVCDCRGA